VQKQKEMRMMKLSPSRLYVGADGKSKMPDYNDTFTVRQLADITAYLISLKGDGHKGH